MKSLKVPQNALFSSKAEGQERITNTYEGGSRKTMILADVLKQFYLNTNCDIYDQDSGSPLIVEGRWLGGGDHKPFEEGLWEAPASMRVGA